MDGEDDVGKRLVMIGIKLVNGFIVKIWGEAVIDCEVTPSVTTEIETDVRASLVVGILGLHCSGGPVV